MATGTDHTELILTDAQGIDRSTIILGIRNICEEYSVIFTGHIVMLLLNEFANSACIMTISLIIFHPSECLA